MAFFAVVGYYIFGYDEETGDKENWGTLSTAMLTLFTFVTVSISRSAKFMWEHGSSTEPVYTTTQMSLSFKYL